MELAVNSIVASKVIFSGQVCNCMKGVYAEDSIYDEFVEKITRNMGQITAEDTLTGINADICSMLLNLRLIKFPRW